MATSAQQKQELFKAIWATAEDLRNSVDGWDFKSYVLGILFYRFISENITNYVNRLQAEAGFEGFDYADFSDDEAEAARQQGLAKMSAQAVGGAVGHNPISLMIPCHRVVGTNGSLTGYGGGIQRKKALLELECADMRGLFVPKKGTAL